MKHHIITTKANYQNNCKGIGVSTLRSTNMLRLISKSFLKVVTTARNYAETVLFTKFPHQEIR